MVEAGPEGMGTGEGTVFASYPKLPTMVNDLSFGFSSSMYNDFFLKRAR